MKKHRKVEYHHGDVHAWREVTEEKVKVKIGELNPAKQKKIKEAVQAASEHNPTDDEPEEVEEDFEQEEGEDALIDAEVEEEEVPE